MINQAVLDQVEEAIDSFEQSWSPESRGKISKLLREYGLTQDRSALTELIRIDIELRYRHNLAVRLDEYFAEFEGLRDDRDYVTQIAFEDFRSRSAGGYSIAASRWAGLPGVREEDWFQQLAWECPSVHPSTAIRWPRIPCEPDPPFPVNRILLSRRSWKHSDSVWFNRLPPARSAAFIWRHSRSLPIVLSC